VADEIANLKDRAKVIWSLGDYRELAEKTRPASEALVEACGLAEGQDVVDVAAGNGNFAILAAKRRARVVAVDLTPEMIELGRARSEAEGVEIEWVEGDAEDLPLEDERFDCAGSVFGSMLTPQPEVAAAELFRVVKPGGVVGMANWIPESFLGRQMAISSRYVPNPENVPPASQWGVEDVVRERFGDRAESIDFERRAASWRFDSRDEMGRWFEQNAGPAVAARRFLPPEHYERMNAEIMQLVDELNQADGGSVLIEPEYLVVVARKR
jgi:ubiquinone/menaquinone biosynthesis C-methylase UbiE